MIGVKIEYKDNGSLLISLDNGTVIEIIEEELTIELENYKHLNSYCVWVDQESGDIEIFNNPNKFKSVKMSLKDLAKENNQ